MDSLGLSPQDYELIVNEIDVIINSAASVNFDDPLKEALNINYHGTARVLSLARDCKKIIVFTQVSTAYVNCNQKGGHIYEQIYEDD